MTKSGRQQMAYRHYVHKHIRERQHHIARANAEAKRKMKRQLSFIEPSAPIVNAGVKSVQPIVEPITVPPSTVTENSETQEEP